MTGDETQSGPWVALFESIADRYDESGVPWFQPIARTLVDLLEPCPGERFLELGSGRGAATWPLARALGPDGRVDALDLAPSMVRLLQQDLDGAGVTNVRLAIGDAGDPRPPDAAYDGVAASLVLFFLPDPVAALTRWRALARPGGRVGISTFPVPTGALLELYELVTEFAGPVRRHAAARPSKATTASWSCSRGPGTPTYATARLPSQYRSQTSTSGARGRWEPPCVASGPTRSRLAIPGSWHGRRDPRPPARRPGTHDDRHRH